MREDAGDCVLAAKLHDILEDGECWELYKSARDREIRAMMSHGTSSKPED